MKKLMTILSVTAVAVFAVGAANGDTLNTGTGFETGAYTLGGDLNTEKDDAGDDLVSEAGRVWGSIPDLESGVAVVSNWNGEYEVAAGNSQYLKLDSAPLISRYAQAGAEPVDIGDGLYIDTLVQFTAADPETPPTPDVDGGDKLCIWLADNEEDPTQCTLMVTAGFVNNRVASDIIPTNYVTTTTLANNSWHHLQVKALSGFDNNNRLGDGFVIFIDGNVVGTTTCPINAEYLDRFALTSRVSAYVNKTDGIYSLFPSLIARNGGGSGGITALSFQGSGAVDNIAFTQGADPYPIDVSTITAEPTAKTGLVENGDEQYGVDWDDTYDDVLWTVTGTTSAITANTVENPYYTATFTLKEGFKWHESNDPVKDVQWSIAAGGGDSGFDGGEAGKTFTIDPTTKAALEAKLPTGKTLGDVADAATGMTYAQAYALGLFDEDTGDIEELNATIEFTAEGKVKVSLDVTTTYKVTLKVYEKASLTAEWPAEAKATYVLGSATEAAGFAPGSGSGSETSEFYKVAIAIENAD